MNHQPATPSRDALLLQAIDSLESDLQLVSPDESKTARELVLERAAELTAQSREVVTNADLLVVKWRALGVRQECDTPLVTASRNLCREHADGLLAALAKQDALLAAGKDCHEALAECLVTMRHARTFIGTREKMHPDGIGIYDADITVASEALRAYTAASTPEAKS